MDKRAPDWLTRCEFQRIERKNFVFDYGSRDEADVAIERLCVAITDEYRTRKSYPSPLKWLRPVCYNAILTCLHHDIFNDLKARIEKYGRQMRGPQTDRSIFAQGIMGICAHDLARDAVKVQREEEKRQTTALIEDRDRARMAEMMWWGFRHYVAPSELVAFNRKNPLHKAIPENARDYLIPHFYPIIVDRRSDAEAAGIGGEHERGAYPDIIEHEVAERMDAYWQEVQKRSAEPDEDWD